MKPLDPRLLRHASAARPFIVACAVLGGITAALVVAQAELLAVTISRAFLDGAALESLGWVLAGLVAVVLGRSAIAWLGETTAHRAAAAVLAQLRDTIVSTALRLGPRHSEQRSPADLAALATRGVDKLDSYFSRYLPQLLIATIVPMIVGARILLLDWVAAAIIGVTVPLIPIFMILIGLYTRRDVRRQWRTLSVLGNHFLDLVAGLAVLTAFGRARAQTTSLREITERYRTQTMRTLRVAFLSALTLELLATLSVAVVAVSIGLRLLSGDLDLHTALVVLILAPEVYLPLRAWGCGSTTVWKGLAAAEEIVALTETQTTTSTRAPAPDPSRVRLRMHGVTVNGRAGQILDNLDLRIEPGEIVGVTGPSGAGKSTLLDLLLGWRRPNSGRIHVNGVDLAELDRTEWQRRIAWVPQQPNLVAGSVSDNIRIGRPDADATALAEAAAAAALDVPLDTLIGEFGAGLSTGQRRRVALARAILADRRLVLLDEPTEGVDADTESAILDRLPAVLAGRTAVVVTHHPAVLDLCDRVIELPGQQTAVTESATSQEPATMTAPSGPTAVTGTSESTVARSKWQPLLDTIRPHRARLALACLAATLALGCGVALTATSSWLIASAALHPPVLSLMVAIVAVRTFGIAKGILRYAERLLSHDVALRALTELRVRVWRQLVRIGPAVTERQRRGDLLHRLVSDVDSQQDVLVRGIVPGVATFLVLAGTATGLGLLLPSAGVVAAIGLFTAGVLAPLVSALATRRGERQSAYLRADVTARTIELMQASADLLAFDAADVRHTRLRAMDDQLTAAARRAARTRGLGVGFASLSVGLTSVVCLVLGIVASVPGPALAVLALTPLAVAEIVAGLPEAAQRLLGTGHAASRLADLDGIPAPQSEPSAASQAPPVHRIDVEHVSVRWPGSGHDAVHDVDFALLPGQRALVTGPSGSGKSTFIAALMRNLDPSGGRILLDNADSRLYTSDSVRAQLAWCGPDAHIFDSTLAENLKLAKPDATETEVLAALERAQLGRWLSILPDGLATRLGTHGTPISGGERQRIAVARALLSDRPVLLLDEPTAHLDEPTAMSLARDLVATTKGKTAILVSHRPAEFPGLPTHRLGPANLPMNVTARSEH
nr:thiol reductant ABC exporter subunit CydD [Kibdelosporangium sp. MJ126-NF4]CEL13292.1 Transport ATP-binding protein CydD [Kibdelosporangium sp. MJ126-NF4]CTQ98983.1 Transport ATP-binding protein CydD [Kibdelosporangium sp. MJ126-NF4]